MILVRMRQHEADDVAALLLGEAEVGQDEVDARRVVALGEGDAAVDHQPFARALVADIVTSSIKDLNLSFPTVSEEKKRLLAEARERLREAPAKTMAAGA